MYIPLVAYPVCMCGWFSVQLIIIICIRVSSPDGGCVGGCVGGYNYVIAVV